MYILPKYKQDSIERVVQIAFRPLISIYYYFKQEKKRSRVHADTEDQQETENKKYTSMAHKRPKMNFSRRNHSNDPMGGCIKHCRPTLNYLSPTARATATKWTRLLLCIAL